MKEILQKVFVKNLHFVIVAVAIFSRSEDYNDHLERMRQKAGQIPAIMNAIGKFKKRAELVEGFLEDLEESKQRLDDISQSIEQVQRQLPEEIKDTDILELFSHEAKAMNIKDIFLRPQSEEKREFYFAKGYKLNATGTYLQFLVYFEHLEKNPRLIEVIELDMVTSKSRRNKGRFELVDVNATMEVFRYDPSVHNRKDVKKKNR